MSETTSFAIPTVPTGSRVVLVVSRGPQPTPPAAYLSVPDVVGHPQGSALSHLQSAGFNARIFNDYSRAYAKGRVMAQLPSGGTTGGSGSEIVLLVSSGPAASSSGAAQLPDVVGMNEAEAVAAIHSANLTPQTTGDYSATVPAGVVMAQVPSRATLATVTEHRVTRTPWLLAALLTVAILALLAFFFLGRAGQVTVPDVVGQTQADAVAELQDAGLEAVVGAAENPGDAAAGTVAQQSPPRASASPAGATSRSRLLPRSRH